MNIESFEPAFMEWAYAREIMRHLGFSADDLFFNVTSIEDGCIISLILRAQGLEFNWAIGVTRLSKSDIKKTYERLCEEWNSDNTNALEGFKKSKAYSLRFGLIKTLDDKGFRLKIQDDDLLS